MKILLIYPPITLHKSDVSSPAKSTLIGLGYVGAALKKAHHHVEIIDSLVSSHRHYFIDSTFTRYGLSDRDILEKVHTFAPHVVGISSMFTSYFKDAHNVARIVKKHNKNILVIFGGAHTTTFPDIVMKDYNVDLSVIGEGEITICEVLDRFRDKKDFHGVKGIYPDYIGFWGGPRYPPKEAEMQRLCNQLS